MRLLLCLLTCLLLTVGPALAQPGSIGVFGDPAVTSCDIWDVGSGLVFMYIVHVFTPGASGCQFRLDVSAASTLIFLGETVSDVYLSLGSSLTGIAIAYGRCVPSPNMVLTVQFFGSGLTAPCTFVEVVPDPNAVVPGIYAVDCVLPVPNLLNATGGKAVINPTGGCMCNVPAEETSWGQIKHLYR